MFKKAANTSIVLSFRPRLGCSRETLDQDVNQSGRSHEPPALRRVQVHGHAADLRADEAFLRAVEVQVFDEVLVGDGAASERPPAHSGGMGRKLSRQRPLATRTPSMWELKLSL